MKRFARKVASALAVTTALFALTAPGAAQSWPSKPVRILVGFGAGGTADILARLLTNELTKTFHGQFIVENRPGSSGVIAAQVVANAEPDGHTLFLAGAGPNLLAPVVNPNAKYQTMRDFTQIAMIAGDSFMLAATPSLGVKSLADLVKIGTTREFPCASPGAGSQGHLLQVLIKQTAKINLVPVPYKGGGDAMGDLVAGQIPLALQPVINVGEQVVAGKAIGLAVASPQRNPKYKNVPTFAELGYPDIRGTSWFWLAGPAKLPADIAGRLNADVRRIVKLDNVKSRLDQAAMQTLDMDLPAMNEFIGEEVKVWGDLARSMNFKVK